LAGIKSLPFLRPLGSAEASKTWIMAFFAEENGADHIYPFHTLLTFGLHSTLNP
jgi:hypothetical protein